MNVRMSVRACIQFYIYSSRLPPSARTTRTGVQPTSQPNPSISTAHTHSRPLTPIFQPLSHPFPTPLTRFPAPTACFRMQPTAYISTRNACTNVRTCVLSFFFLIPNRRICAFWGYFFPYYLCLMRIHPYARFFFSFYILLLVLELIYI